MGWGGGDEILFSPLLQLEDTDYDELDLRPSQLATKIKEKRGAYAVPKDQGQVGWGGRGGGREGRRSKGTDGGGEGGRGEGRGVRKWRRRRSGTRARSPWICSSSRTRSTGKKAQERTRCAQPSTSRIPKPCNR
eukprot:449655-Hanusia_phi.AAC.1